MFKQISEIIPFLEKSLNATILDYTAAPLTAQGDNFGSNILAINVKVKLNNLCDILSEVRFYFYVWIWRERESASLNWAHFHFRWKRFDWPLNFQSPMIFSHQSFNRPSHVSKRMHSIWKLYQHYFNCSENVASMTINWSTFLSTVMVHVYHLIPVRMIINWLIYLAYIDAMEMRLISNFQIYFITI